MFLKLWEETKGFNYGAQAFLELAVILLPHTLS